jgi:spermidine synthase
VVANNHVVVVKEGLTASVMVAEQPSVNNLFLAVNGKVEASTAGDMETQLMCAHLPLLLHPAPRDVLVIGLASGITAGAVATHPVRSIRVAQIEAAMIPAARRFDSVNGGVLNDPRLRLTINDARNELTFSPRRYDVVVSEPSNPWMTVASNLFTEEFFRLARERLHPAGIFSQWIQTYGLATEDPTLAYIEKFAVSPLEYVAPAPPSPENRHRLRVQLVGAWMARDQKGRSRAIVAEIAPGPLRDEAERLLNPPETAAGREGPSRRTRETGP